MSLTAAVVGACSPQLYDQATYTSDDMYSAHDREAIIQKQQARYAAAERLRAERMNQWSNILGYEQQTAANVEIVDISSYQTPYGERLLALSNETYQRPSSYYQLEYNNANLEMLSAYDPAEYNAYIDDLGNIVVSPKYISSMYGSWGDPYGASWVYGYPTWGYYSTFGYPRYGWYDWQFGTTFGYYAPYYDPWWGYSPYYYGYYGGYGWHRPYPNYYGGGAPRRTTLVKRADPYTAPSAATSPPGGGTVRRKDGSTVGRSTGTTYNRGGSTTTSPSSTSPTRVTQPTSTTPSSGQSVNAIGR